MHLTRIGPTFDHSSPVGTLFRPSQAALSVYTPTTRRYEPGGACCSSSSSSTATATATATAATAPRSQFQRPVPPARPSSAAAPAATAAAPPTAQEIEDDAEAALIEIAPWDPKREFRLLDRPVTLTSEAPPLEMELRFMGIGGTVMNARSQNDQLEAMFQVNNHEDDLRFIQNTTIGKRDEARVALACAAQRRARAPRALQSPIHYCAFCIHPTFPPLRTTPDFVDRQGIWQIKRRAGAKRRDRIEMHLTENCTRSALSCRCPRPTDWVGQINLEMFTSGMRLETLGVGSDINADFTVFRWSDAVASRWWPRVWPELRDLYTGYAEWYWTDGRSMPLTLHARAWLEYYNYKVGTYNQSVVSRIATLAVSYLGGGRSLALRVAMATTHELVQVLGRTMQPRQPAVLSVIFARRPVNPAEVPIMRRWRAVWNARRGGGATLAPTPPGYHEWDTHCGAYPIGWILSLVIHYADEMDSMPRHRALVDSLYAEWAWRQHGQSSGDAMVTDVATAATRTSYVPALEVDWSTWDGIMHDQPAVVATTAIPPVPSRPPHIVAFQRMRSILLATSGVLNAACSDSGHISLLLADSAVEQMLRTAYQWFFTVAKDHLIIGVLPPTPCDRDRDEDGYGDCGRPSVRKRSRRSPPSSATRGARTYGDDSVLG